MFEIIYNGLKGLVVNVNDSFYQVNFGNNNYDLNKWLSCEEINAINYII